MSTNHNRQSASPPADGPDFVIVGAPRCGTTALSHYLAEHPRVCFSSPKETHYFTGLWTDDPVRDFPEKYLPKFFPHRRAARHEVLGEGSVSYLYLDEALRRILHVNPEAKLVAMVRNPLDQLPSYHQRLRFLLEEDVEDFARAWRLQETRAHGEQLPRLCRVPRLLQYAEVGRLGARIGRLFEIAGRERCHVIVFDDFAADTRAVYRRVLDFIGVADDGRTDFPPRRMSRVVRRRWLHRVVSRWVRPALFWLPLPLARVVDLFSRNEGPRLAGLKRLTKRLADANTVVQKPAPLNAQMQAELRDTFAPDVEMLGGLLGRDLSHWLQAEEPAARAET